VAIGRLAANPHPLTKRSTGPGVSISRPGAPPASPQAGAGTHGDAHKKSPAATAAGDKVRNHYSALNLGNFAWRRRVNLVLIGARFTIKGKIWRARLLHNSPLSPSADGRGQNAKDDYHHGKCNQEP
jgi:hypothetical protein